MRAHPGDWLVIERGDLGHHARRGLIEQVHDPDGAPPYRVRWVDTDQVTLVMPGPDAHVLTPDEIAAADRAARARFDRVRQEIVRHPASGG